MKRTISFSFVVFFFFMVCGAEAAIFNVSNVTEFQDALTAARDNSENDTIRARRTATVLIDMVSSP